MISIIRKSLCFQEWWANSKAESVDVDTLFRHLEFEQRSCLIIKFWTKWCGYCRLLAPMYENLIEEYKGKNITFTRVNGDENQAMIQEFKIRGYPTLAIMYPGDPEFQSIYEGNKNEVEIKRWIDKYCARYLNTEGNYEMTFKERHKLYLGENLKNDKGVNEEEEEGMISNGVIQKDIDPKEIIINESDDKHKEILPELDEGLTVKKVFNTDIDIEMDLSDTKKFKSNLKMISDLVDKGENHIKSMRSLFEKNMFFVNNLLKSKKERIAKIENQKSENHDDKYNKVVGLREDKKDKIVTIDRDDYIDNMDEKYSLIFHLGVIIAFFAITIATFLIVKAYLNS